MVSKLFGNDRWSHLIVDRMRPRSHRKISSVRKRKKSKHTKSDANPVPPTAPNYRKPRVPPPSSGFAFPNPITPIAPPNVNDHDMPDVDPGDDLFADLPEHELTELERYEA